MSNTDLIIQVVIGIGIMAGAQMLKGDKWVSWVTLLLPLIGGYGTGVAVQGTEGGAVTALAALASHSFVRQSRLGNALKLEIVPRVIKVVAELLQRLASAQTPPTPPTTPGIG